MEYIRRYYLPVTVFLTGGAVLVLEIVATRMLSPYFGNTIYTVSSVLSVVLAALSAGYYVGGRLADSRPSKKLFFSLIFVSGLGVFIMQFLQVVILPELSRLMSITTGPLVAGLLLFFVPSFTLGMLSPFAIKLADLQHKTSGIGSIAGEIFFFSTMGSIVGSLLAGYVLIPYLPVSAIITGTGIGLVLLGLVPLLFAGFNKRHGLAIIALLLVSGGAASAMPSHSGALYSANGQYHQLTVTDGFQNDRPIRLLYQDNMLAGAMYLDSSTDLYSNYQKFYTFSEPVQGRAPKNAAVIGGGMYIAPRALLQTYPNVHVDAVEIEPSLPSLAERYFDLPPNPRLSHHIADGRRFLHDTPRTYDVIFSDVYLSLYSTPMHFTTEEFFRLAYDKLASDGVFLANIIDTTDDNGKSVLRAEAKTLGAVFPHVYAFAMEGPKTPGLQNFILVGYKGKAPLSFTSTRFTQSKHEIMRSLPKLQVPLSALNLDAYRVLTDNYAPIDNWPASLLD